MNDALMERVYKHCGLFQEHQIRANHIRNGRSKKSAKNSEK